jgi:hypothetical protein
LNSLVRQSNGATTQHGYHFFAVFGCASFITDRGCGSLARLSCLMQRSVIQIRSHKGLSGFGHQHGRWRNRANSDPSAGALAAGDGE